MRGRRNLYGKKVEEDEKGEVGEKEEEGKKGTVEEEGGRRRRRSLEGKRWKEDGGKGAEEEKG